MAEDSAYQKTRGERATLAEFGRLLARSVELDMHTALPGVVVSTTPGVPGVSPATARVQPSLQAVYLDHAGEEMPLPLPPVPAAIVGFYTSATHRETKPVPPGTMGWLFVSERSLEGYRNGAGQPADPKFSHTHQLQDSLFLPCGPASANPATLDDTAWSVATNTGSPLEPGEISMDTLGMVTVEGPTVRLGRFAAQPAVRGTVLMAALSTYIGAIAGAFTTWGGTVPPTPISNGVFITALSTATAALTGALATVLSTKVLVE